MGTPRVRKHFKAALPVLEGPHTPQKPNSRWGCWSNTSHSPQEPWGSSAGRFLPSSQSGPVRAGHSLPSSALAWDRGLSCLRCWPSTKEFIFKFSQHTANSKCLNLTHSGRAEVGAESRLGRRKGRELGRGARQGHSLATLAHRAQSVPRGALRVSGDSQEHPPGPGTERALTPALCAHSTHHWGNPKPGLTLPFPASANGAQRRKSKPHGAPFLPGVIFSPPRVGTADRPCVRTAGGRKCTQ